MSNFADRRMIVRAKIRTAPPFRWVLLLMAFAVLVVCVSTIQGSRHLAGCMTQVADNVRDLQVLENRFALHYDTKAKVHLQHGVSASVGGRRQVVPGYAVLDLPAVSARMCPLVVIEQLDSGFVVMASVNGTSFSDSELGANGERLPLLVNTRTQCTTGINSLSFRYPNPVER